MWLCINITCTLFFSCIACSTYSSDDVSSQHPVCLLVAEDLHHAVGVGVGFGPAVGCKGEFANFVRDALRGAWEGVGREEEKGGKISMTLRVFSCHRVNR